MRVRDCRWLPSSPVIAVAPSLTTFQILYIGNATYPVSATLIKLALLFQYLRVFGAGTRTQTFCKYMIVISAAWGATFMMLRWVPCFPVDTYWNFSVEDVRCWGFGSRNPLPFMRVFVAQAISTAVLDFIVFAIPIQLSFKSETRRNTRLCLLVLFIFGFLYVIFDASPLRALPSRWTLMIPNFRSGIDKPTGLSRAPSYVWSSSFGISPQTHSGLTQAGMMPRQPAWPVSRSISPPFARHSPYFGQS